MEGAISSNGILAAADQANGTIASYIIGGAAVIMFAFFLRAYVFADKTSRTERADLHRRIDQLQIERTRLETEIQAARTNQFAAETRAATAEASVAGLTTALQYSHETVQRLKEDNEQLEQEVERLQNRRNPSSGQSH